MTPSDSGSTSVLHNRAFLLLLALVSLAFVGVIAPFFGAAFWGLVLAIVFAPLYDRLLPLCRQHRTWTALATLGVVLLLVILPVTLLSLTLVSEGTAVYQRLRSGQIDIGQQFEQLTNALPTWVQGLLERFGVADFGTLTRKIGDAASRGGQAIAARALDIGSNTLDVVVSFFVALYLLFFLLRDGADIAGRIRDAIPIETTYKRRLFDKFTVAIRATVKGNVLVAAVQGALGGLAFWVLGIHAAVVWAVAMALLSLLPAIGAGLVWAPVAIWLLASGAVVKGVALVAWGVLAIGLVDNVLRPILVGKDIQMPDWLVLLATLGGIAVFGLNGFVIGPVIAAMFISVWGIVIAERQTLD